MQPCSSTAMSCAVWANTANGAPWVGVVQGNVSVEHGAPAVTAVLGEQGHLAQVREDASMLQLKEQHAIAEALDGLDHADDLFSDDSFDGLMSVMSMAVEM